MERRSYVELAGNGGYFSKFEWKPDPFENFRKALTERRVAHEEAQKVVHGNAPFLSNPKRPLPLKHESYF